MSAVLAELQPALADARIRDVARIENRDDLLLFLEVPDGGCALHLVTGGQRARVTLTQRRFRKHEFRTGPLVDRLRERLIGRTFGPCRQHPGERTCSFELRDAAGPTLELHVELFGARGFWCLADDTRTILELSRLPESAHRELRPGATYSSPEARGAAPTEPAPRFTVPVLDAVDELFTAHDRDEEFTRQKKDLQVVLQRATRKLRHKIDGLARQREEISRIDELRTQADMLLAYGFSQPPGATSMQVPDPQDPDRELTIALDPGKPVQTQAERIYKKARKLDDGAARAQQQAAAAQEELVSFAACAADLAETEDLAAVRACRERMTELGLLREKKPKAEPRKKQKLTKGYSFRRFTSAEGYLILVGRTNHENDRLSISVARGNDLWFHVGQGYAGSHVVIRLPRGKTASLESLLDAATLAHYYSKARNHPRVEVIYTQAKNVRKPKGLPPGRVTTGPTKTVLVDREADRLRRLLDSAETES